MLSFVAVVVALGCQVLLLGQLVWRPELEGLRESLARPWRWLARRKVLTKTASFAGVSGGLLTAGAGAIRLYGDVHLASRTLLPVLTAADVFLAALLVGSALWAARTAGRVSFGAAAACCAVAVMGGSLLTVRVLPNCEVLHPFDEPPMSSQREGAKDWVAAAPKAPIRPALPPPLVSAPSPRPAGPGWLRAARIPPLNPAAQSEPTAEPIGGCLRHRHDL